MITRPMQRSHLPLAFVLSAALLALTCWHRDTFTNWHIDLEVYRHGWDAWLAGRDLYGPMPEVQGGNPLPFLYPPFALLALSPVLVTPWPVAITLLILASLTALALTLYWTVRALWPALDTVTTVAAAGGATSLAVLLLEPVDNTLGFGQVNLVLMALVAVDVLPARERQWRGVGVGIAAAIKLTPLLFIAYFLLRGQRRAAVTATAAFLVMTGAGCLLAPQATWTMLTFDVAGLREVAHSPFRTNQTVSAALARLGAGDAGVLGAWLLFAVVLLALTAVIVYLGGDDRLTGVIATAACTVLISPTSWSHHWVWCAPALLILATTAVRRWRYARPGRWGWAAATLSAAVVFTTGAFHDLPGYNNAELGWTPAEHVLGNGYVLLACTLLLSYGTAVCWRAITFGYTPPHLATQPNAQVALAPPRATTAAPARPSPAPPGPARP